MSNSVVSEEVSVWAQTFVTVTPHDDGFLREIEENVVVSGPADTPLHLDTWNIVLRRSLMDTTKNFIDSTELEQSIPVEVECQTYLQGVPKVELPIACRDEATQTLYMGRGGRGAAIPLEYFNDIITVLNEKPLPEQKTSRIVHTIITKRAGTSESDLIRMLIETENDLTANDSESIITTTDRENAIMEASDTVNFIVDRALWITKSESLAPREKREASTQTAIKYNSRTKKLDFDHEVQTKLTCEPKYSNSMLLATYNDTKNFCRARIEECVEKGVYTKIEIENIVEEIMTNCNRRLGFPVAEKIGKKDEDEAAAIYEKVDMNEKGDQSNSRRCSCQINAKVDKIIRPIRALLANENRYPDERIGTSMVNRCCAAAMSRSSRSESSNRTSSSRSNEQSSSSQGSLTSRDAQILGILKSALCNREI